MALVGLIVGVWVLWPKVADELAPTLEQAWAAIEVEGSGLAVVGPVDLEVGQTFRLHAVLGARDRQGRELYYTEAKRLRLAGAEIAQEALRPYDLRKSARVRWYTVEGRQPFLPLDPETGIRAFTMEEFLRSDWPLAWSIAGAIDPAHDDHLESGSAPRSFGIQRYQVRIELYDDAKNLVPSRVLRSWGVAELRERIAEFPTVRLRLPGAAGPVSEVFGLTELEPPAGAPFEVLQQIDELARNGVAFSRLSVISAALRSAGKSFQSLSWQKLELGQGARWGVDLDAGDLMRAGDRLVILKGDAEVGALGTLDSEDLCFDFAQGASLRPIGEVFVGDGEVEVARLTPGTSQEKQ